MASTVARSLREIADLLSPQRFEDRALNSDRGIASELRVLRDEIHEDVSKIVLASLADPPKGFNRMHATLMVLAAAMAVMGILAASWSQTLEERQGSLVEDAEMQLSRSLLLGDSVTTDKSLEDWRRLVEADLEDLTEFRADVGNTQDRNRFWVPLSLAASTLGAALLGALVSIRLQTAQMLQGRINILERLKTRTEARLDIMRASGDAAGAD